MDKKRQIPETEQKQQIDMEKSLEEIKDPELKEMFSTIWERVKTTEIYKEVEEVRKKIINAPKRPDQLVFAFIPHEMAKVSIFSPMSDRELKEERRVIQKIEHESSWGKIVIEGVKLAIFEEDIFLALTHLIKDNFEQFKNNFILEVNINKIVHILYGDEGYSKRNRDVILNTLKRLKLVSFDLLFGNWKKRELEIKKWISMSIIHDFVYDEDSKMLKVYFDPRFVGYFFESLLTNINFTIRRRLKKDGSKAILRFLTAHTQPGRMHLLTVLNAINFNTNQPMYALRRRFKQFIAELKKHGVLGPKTKLYTDDTVYFDILPFKKALPV